MDPIIERCCGLDVHQATVVACVLVAPAHQKARKESRTFGTKTRELMDLHEIHTTEEAVAALEEREARVRAGAG